MDEFKIDFWERKEKIDQPYDITINETRGVVVGGCDCEDTMSDIVALEVYKKLGKYLEYKGLLKSHNYLIQAKALENMPRWKVLGFGSEQALLDFENRPDFPGWEML